MRKWEEMGGNGRKWEEMEAGERREERREMEALVMQELREGEGQNHLRRRLLVLQVVAVVRVGEADGVGRRRLALVHLLLLQVRVGARGAVRQVVVPHDQVHPLARRDVVGAVAAAAQVHDAVAAHVLVRVREVAVARLAHVAAEGQRRAWAGRVSKPHMRLMCGGGTPMVGAALGQQGRALQRAKRALGPRGAPCAELGDFSDSASRR